MNGTREDDVTRPEPAQVHFDYSDGEHRVPWGIADNCILCLKQFGIEELDRRSEEHLIGESVGGRLTSDFLCKRCNSQVARYDAEILAETSIRFTLEAQRNRIPGLYQIASAKQPFTARLPGAENDWLRVIRDNGRLRPQRRQPSGELIATPESKPGFIAHIEKLGLSKPGGRVITPEFVEVWPIPGPMATYLESGREYLSPGCGTGILKMAFEFLALCSGAEIYGECFDPSREGLLKDDPKRCVLKVRSLAPRSRPCFPIHRLWARLDESDHIVVFVCLFGYCGYELTFPIKANRARFADVIYSLNLEVDEQRESSHPVVSKLGKRGPFLLDGHPAPSR